VKRLERAIGVMAQKAGTKRNLVQQLAKDNPYSHWSKERLQLVKSGNLWEFHPFNTA
jgi:hypothetical protein